MTGNIHAILQLATGLSQSFLPPYVALFPGDGGLLLLGLLLRRNGLLLLGVLLLRRGWLLLLGLLRWLLLLGLLLRRRCGLLLLGLLLRRCGVLLLLECGFLDRLLALVVIGRQAAGSRRLDRGLRYIHMG